MRIRQRTKVNSIHVQPEDRIRLIHRQEIEFPDGHVESSEREVLEERIGREMTLDEAVIFDVEAGDFEGANDGIGGALLVTKQVINKEEA